MPPFSLAQMRETGRAGLFIGIKDFMYLSQDSLLYRLHYTKVVKPEFALVWDFKITYEMAKNWRKAHNAYLRQNQWKDLIVRVCLDVG